MKKILFILLIPFLISAQGFFDTPQKVKTNSSGYYLQDTTKNVLFGAADTGDYALKGLWYRAWDGSMYLGGATGLFWDNVGKGLGIKGTPINSFALSLYGDIYFSGANSINWGNGDALISKTGYNLDFKLYNGSTTSVFLRISSDSTITLGSTQGTGTGKIITRSIELEAGSAPGIPTKGTIYYDSVANKLKVWTGAAWETITSAP